MRVQSNRYMIWVCGWVDLWLGDNTALEYLASWRIATKNFAVGGCCFHILCG